MFLLDHEGVGLPPFSPCLGRGGGEGKGEAVSSASAQSKGGGMDWSPHILHEKTKTNMLFLLLIVYGGMKLYEGTSLWWYVLQRNTIRVGRVDH